MELLYIWIKKYKGLKDVGLNLGNQFRFHYDEQKGVLEVKPTEYYIPGFFGENITNFTGIIGENGTGKTTILRYIMQYFTTGSSDTDKNGIVVYYHNQRFYFFSNHKITIAGTHKTLFEKIDDIEEFKDSSALVFASNHFDPTSQYSFDYTKQQLGDTKNLSTNVLLQNDVQKRKKFVDVELENTSFKEHISAFAAHEFIRIVKLLRWINNKSQSRNPFPAQLPPYINLSLYFNQGSPNSERQIKLRQKLSAYLSMEMSKRNRFLLNSFEAGIFNLMDEGSIISNSRADKFYVDIDESIISYISSKKQSKKNVIDELIEILKYLRNDKWKALNKKLEGIQQFILQLSSYLDTKNGR